MSAYIGSWVLMPELTQGQSGATAGRYSISQDGEELVFHVSWEQGGEAFETSFSAVPDGRQTPSPHQGIDTFSVMHDSDHQLSGDAWGGGEQIGLSMRRVSADGQLMSIMQHVKAPDGRQILSVQLYQRAND